MSPDVIFGSIGVVLFVAIVFEVWKYVRGHPQALASVEKELANLKGQVSSAVSTDTAAIHAKLDALTTKVDATHAAALAPVTVTVVPATPSGSVTDKLFPQAAPNPRAAPAALPTPTSPALSNEGRPADLGWTNGQWLYDLDAKHTYNVTPPAGFTGYYSVQSQYTGGPSPAFVTYEIAGVVHEFLGTFQQWSTNDMDFPRQVLAGPFSITVTMLDANHQPTSGFALQIQQNHG